MVGVSGCLTENPIIDIIQSLFPKLTALPALFLYWLGLFVVIAYFSAFSLDILTCRKSFCLTFEVRFRLFSFGLTIVIHLNCFPVIVVVFFFAKCVDIPEPLYFINRLLITFFCDYRLFELLLLCFSPAFPLTLQPHLLFLYILVAFLISITCDICHIINGPTVRFNINKRLAFIAKFLAFQFCYSFLSGRGLDWLIFTLTNLDFRVWLI